MAKSVFSATYFGLNCHIVTVEADIMNGLPNFSIVGLGDTSIQESKERVRSAIKNSGMSFPQNRKTINLAPAEIKKQGTLLDLPIALSLLVESAQVEIPDLESSIFVGELSLNGDLMPINGALLIARHARKNGYKKIFLPEKNSVEAGFIEGIEIYPVKNLRQLLENFASEDLSKNTIAKLIPPDWQEFISTKNSLDEDIIPEIVGLHKAKRALVIALTGGHNVLLTGSPGGGKTAICKAFESLLPEMSREEILECSQIFSVAGLLNKNFPLITRRSFRSVHHTASLNSVIGGGITPKPGEISLAHRGVLFFDEIGQFSAQILEALRQPLEDKIIHLNRVNYSCTFPCDFIFLATMNPCPCGFFGDKKIDCHCTINEIRRYHKKISGPIRDRFDLFVNVEKEPVKNLIKNSRKISAISEINGIFAEMNNGIQIQKSRFRKNFGTNPKNANMTLADIKKYCALSPEQKNFLDNAATKLNLSARGYLKILKVTRTIADLSGSENILQEHLAEALQFRE